MKISKQDWLTAGLSILKEKGFKSIRLEDLCAYMQVTKGSFYHHFGSADRYVTNLLEHWEHTMANLWLYAAEDEPEPDRRLQVFMRAMLDDANDARQIEAAFMAWSTVEPEVALCLNRIKRQRFEFVKRQYLKIYMSDMKIATLNAQMYMACFTGFLSADLSQLDAYELQDLELFIQSKII